LAYPITSHPTPTISFLVHPKRRFGEKEEEEDEAGGFQKTTLSKRRTRSSGGDGRFEFSPHVVKFFDASTTASHATPTSHAAATSIKEEETLVGTSL